MINNGYCVDILFHRWRQSGEISAWLHYTVDIILFTQSFQIFSWSSKNFHQSELFYVPFFFIVYIKVVGGFWYWTTGYAIWVAEITKHFSLMHIGCNSATIHCGWNMILILDCRGYASLIVVLVVVGWVMSHLDQCLEHFLHLWNTRIYAFHLYLI